MFGWFWHVFECFFFMCLYFWKFLAFIICRFGCFFSCVCMFLCLFYHMIVCLADFQYSRLSAASVLRRLKGEARVTSAGQRQPLLNQPELCQLWELSPFICIIITTNQNFAARGLLGLSTFVFRSETNCLFVSNQEQWALHVTSLAKCSSTAPLCSCGLDWSNHRPTHSVPGGPE